MTEPLPPELSAQPILDTLRRHVVDFVVIGGLAGMAHGSTYPTFDLDVAYSRDTSNLERLVAALRELGARPRAPGVEETATQAAVEGVPVAVASLDHLIAMKRAAARTKDRIMLDEYIALADEQRPRAGR